VLKKYKYLAFFILILGSYIFSKVTEKRNKKNEFLEGYEGIITDMRYDPKTIPYITINDNLEYYLGNYPIQKGNNLEIGDSIYKKVSSNIFKHYKKYENGYYLYETYRISKW